MGSHSALPRVNAFVRNHFVHLISVIAVLAFLTPRSSQWVRAHRLFDDQLDASGVSLFLMMVSAAIQCSFGAFRRVIARPRALFVCLGLYFVMLPLACFLLGQTCVPLLGRTL